MEISLSVDIGVGKVRGRSGGLEKSHTSARGPGLEPGACRWVLGFMVSALPTLPGLGGPVTTMKWIAKISGRGGLPSYRTCQPTKLYAAAHPLEREKLVTGDDLSSG